MGVKLMTGATGEQNIQAADDRECLAGITGLDSYVFPTGSQLKAALVDANTVTIGTGAGSLQGSRFRCPTTTTVNIQSGTQGQHRRDIIGLHFSRETSGREGLEFQVLTGEPAASEDAATDPAYTVGDLLKGDADAFMPLYRVKLSGINAADPEPMFSVLAPLATLGDSVSHDDTKNRSWNQNNWGVNLQHMFGDLYYLQIQRTYSSFGGASGTEILRLDGVRPRSTIQLALTGYVATVAVIYGAARIDANGQVTINAPGYGSAVTILVSGYVVLD